MKFHSPLFISVAVASLSLPHLASAQGDHPYRQVFEIQGQEQGDGFGSAICGLGDVDGDGVNDFMVSAPSAMVDSTPNVGKVYVYSGKSQSVIYTLDGYRSYRNFGQTLAPGGDINMDGYADFLIGQPKYSSSHRGMVWAYSGKTGQILDTHYGSYSDYGNGASIDGGFNFDDDGYDDYIVGSRGYVSVYSGRNGYRLFYFCPSIGPDYGKKVGGLKDIDGDGIDDFAIGDPRLTGGRVDVHSGETGRLIYAIGAEIQDTLFGRDFDQISDINSDGVGDIIVTTKEGWKIFSGANGSLIRGHTIGGFESADWFRVSTLGDLNRDGTVDFLISTPSSTTGSNPKATCWDGATIKEFFTIEGSADDVHYLSIAKLGDSDDNRDVELLVGNLSGISAGTGLVKSLELNTYLQSGVHEISASKGGNVVFRIDFPDDFADLEYRMLISKSGDGPAQFGVAVPLTPDTLTRDSLSGNYPVNTHYNMHGTLDFEGAAWASFAFPKNMPNSMIGQCFRFAAVAAPEGSLPVISSGRQAIDIVP